MVCCSILDQTETLPIHTSATLTITISFGVQNLNPSLVNNVRLKGNVKPISILSTNLPTLEDIADVGLEFLEAPRLLPKRRTKLFIGVFSTANNFDRRMAVRRSWMQYETVRSGDVTVRFFVGQVIWYKISMFYFLSRVI